MGKILAAIGAAIMVLGLAIWGLSSVPFIGRLPGDFEIRGDNYTFYFPLTTCIAIGIVASIVFALIRRW
ncbi:MAG: DUF2905 domain-containing protein [Candidatus Binataceae bacterium]